MIFSRLAALAMFGGSVVTVGANWAGSKPIGLIRHYSQAPATAQKQVNLTVLLDLSDRIKVKYGADDQQQRDEAIVQNTAEWFKQLIAKQNAFGAKGCYTVAFEPYPQNLPNLSVVANSMHYDLNPSGIEQKALLRIRKEAYMTMVPNVTKGVQQLYHYVATQPFKGADLWGFMHDNYVQRYLRPSSTYRNVLVVVTDGYIDHVKYHKMFAQGNKVAYINDEYITKNLIKNAGFTSSNWQAKYTAGRYGLQVPTGVNLQGTEVIVLGEYVYGRPPIYDEIVARYVTDWFKGMGASRVIVRKTDLNNLTRDDINQFLQ